MNLALGFRIGGLRRVGGGGNPAYYVLHNPFDGTQAGWDDVGDNYDDTGGSLVSVVVPNTFAEPYEYTAGIARVTGRTLAAVVIPQDRHSDFALGWASATGVATPLEDGHNWLNQDGFLQVSQPGETVRLSGTGTDDYDVRPMEHLVGVAMNATGALYFARPFAVGDGSPALGRDDPRNTLADDEAWVLWREDANTDATMHPVVNFHSQFGMGWIDDLRVVDVAAWSAADFEAVYTMRFPADGSLPSGWTSPAGTWAVSGNKLTVSSGGIAQRAYVTATGASGDNFWRCKYTHDTSNDNGNAGFLCRVVDATNFIQFTTNGAQSIVLNVRVAGADAALYSGFFDWTVGQTYDICVLSVGNKYALWVDGTNINGWMTDAGSNHLTGSGIGAWTWGATDAKWDDFVIDPVTVTLPEEVLHGLVPTPWTVGSTLFTEAFTAANGTALETHDADFTDLGTTTIESNRAVTDAGFTYGAAGSTDYEVSVDIVLTASPATIRSGLFLRYVDASQDHLWIRCFRDPGQPGTDEIEFGGVVGGVDPGIQKVQFPSYWANSGTIALRAQVLGDLCRVYLDDQPVFSRVLTLATGDPGVYLEGAVDTGTEGFDNFVIKALTA
jgi:hypothetical protein